MRRSWDQSEEGYKLVLLNYCTPPPQGTTAQSNGQKTFAKVNEYSHHRLL